MFRFSRLWLMAAIFLTALWANPGLSQQFNRIGYVMKIGECYTPQAAAQLGGAANLQVDMNNNVAWANVAMQNSGTGIWVENTGYFETAEADPGSLSALLSQFYNWPDVQSFYSTNGPGVLQCLGIGTDDAGLSYECWYPGTVSAVYLSPNCFTHELGRNTCGEEGDGYGGNGLVTIMLFNYCGGNNLAYFSSPGAYYNGIQLLGSTNNDCGQGPLANQGNNARAFALNGTWYQGANPVPVSSLNFYNPLLTAVHCGGAAVGTTNADQRTFAADQNYSGGNAWNANGYSYTVNVSGVTDPAPQTAYQDQRYGNMTYTFTNFQPGTNYLVRLHCMECCWSASGQRIFNVFINGVKVLSNFDIYATAGAQNKAVIREITTTANANGKIAVQFVNVVDNASISAIEILQGGLFAPVNLSALPGNGQVSLSWNAVTGAASYNVKRATLSGGPYTTVGTATATNYTDNPVAGTTTYYYVVSAVNGGNESFDSAEAGATTPVTVNTDTWVGGSGNNFSPVANWTYSIGAGPITNSDALVFDSVGSTTPNNDLTGFNISTLTFNPGAQAYTIGGNAFTLGTNSVSPVIAVNSANSQTINNNITLINANSTVSTASGNLKLGGVVSGTASLTKIGGQTLTFSGNNSFTGATAVSDGTLAITAGTFAPASLFAVGNTTGGNAVLNISGGSVAANYNSGQFNSSLVVGSASGSAGDVKFGGSTFSVNQQFGLGAGNGGYGAFEMSGGTATMGSFVVVGFNTDNSVLNMRGGSLTINNNLMTVAAGGSSSMGVVNLSGGTFNSIATTGYSPTIGGTFVGENGTGTLNVSGTALVNLSGWGLRMGHNSGANGTVNLLGGTVATTAVSRGSGTATLNFNGGILKARAANPSFLTGLTAAYVYGGGANINDGGFAITVGQPLLAPTGYGVASIAINNGGSGYIAPPVVKLTGGAGSGATAMAQIDYTLGTVTNILVTSPGVNYLNTDALTVALAGGGGSGAGGQAVLAANTSGGLTKVGGSTLTLTNVSTYAGRTTISAGTLLLSGNGSIANSTSIMVGSGAGFNVSSVSGGYTLDATQTLLGNGTVTGTVTVNGTVAPGASAASIGTLTFNSAPVLNGNLLMKISRTNAQTADKITLTSGTLRFGGTLLVTNLAGALAAGDSFKLFSAGSYSGAFASLSPATPGQGLVWNTNTLAVDGTLLVAAAAPPVIGSFAQSGDGFLLMSIAGGPPGSPYRVLASTNLVLPLTNWTPVWTDTFNLDGSGQFTNPAGPANAQQFFNIAVP